MTDTQIRFHEIDGDHVAFVDGHPAGYIYLEDCTGEEHCEECWGYRHHGQFDSEMDHLGDLDHVKATVRRALEMLA